MIKNKSKVALYLNTIIAILLGTYAQDIAYFVENNFNINKVIILVVSTIISILFFIKPYINKNNKEESKVYKLYLFMNGIIGLIVSFFSIIVLIAWLG